MDFRRTDAFAKGGRERYGYAPSLREDFAGCLRESADPAPGPAARAARAYLDVAFFHPFPDGNGRCAMLALCHVLESAGIGLDLVGPLTVTRYADDPAGAADLAVLVGVLARAARRRAARRAGRRRAPVAWGHGIFAGAARRQSWTAELPGAAREFLDAAGVEWEPLNEGGLRTFARYVREHADGQEEVLQAGLRIMVDLKRHFEGPVHEALLAEYREGRRAGSPTWWTASGSARTGWTSRPR
ncbi:Fic family protein [Kitasatospora saccharophila]|uniref:Fic family protein n=1 Tax=Kitasatospora saccharophila TaxID=407973 RepID=UPI003626BDB5